MVHLFGAHHGASPGRNTRGLPRDLAWSLLKFRVRELMALSGPPEGARFN